MERLRLQKVNKKLAAEKDDLSAQLAAEKDGFSAQLASSGQRLSAAEGAARDSSQAQLLLQAQVSELQVRVSELQAASAELSETRRRLGVAEARLVQLEGVEVGLKEAERERDVLREKVRRPLLYSVIESGSGIVSGRRCVSSDPV